MPKSTKPNLVPYAVIGIFVILLFMFLYSRISSTQEKKQISDTVTTENEFTKPIELPDPVSDEEARAREEFTFSISSPIDGATVKSSNIKVMGNTVANADVFVNDIDGKADKNGNFSITYILDEGENYLIVGANDEFGNFNETEITVYYQN